MHGWAAFSIIAQALNKVHNTLCFDTADCVFRRYLPIRNTLDVTLGYLKPCSA